MIRCGDCGVEMKVGTSIVIQTETGIHHECSECKERIDWYGPVMVLN
jgi:hypothetical protein